MSCITTNIGGNGGCLSARISRVGNTLNANIGLADEHIIATISRLSGGLKANIGIVDESLIATISRISGNLKANVGIICTPNTGIILRFENDRLLWEKEENVVGVTKYNVLIASDGWELKEVEELL